MDTPLILSLIYDGGTILASKRSPYDDLLPDNFDEKILAQRLSRQHKLLCAAIRAGRLEDLKQMTRKESDLKKGLVVKEKVKEQTEKIVEKIISEPIVEKSIPKPSDEITLKKPVRTQTYTSELQDKINSAKSTLENRQSQTDKPHIAGIPAYLPAKNNEVLIIDDVRIIEEPTIYDAVQKIIEDEIVLPPEAVEIIGDLSQFESLIDDELKISFVGGDTFSSGEHKNINILVCRGNIENAVKDANVVIKILGSSFRPLIFHSKTDSNGIAGLTLKIPTFKSGRAAILVRVNIKGEETEIRRVISPEV